METDEIKFCCDCTNKNCPEEMPDPNSMACSFFIGKENVCKNCKHFARKTTHCKKGVPWISEDDSCNNFEQKTKMTNGDKIRQMSNEELWEYFHLYMDCPDCPVVDECRTVADCKKNLLGWLNAPAESER